MGLIMAKKYVYFACSGRFKDDEIVWISSKQRRYSPNWGIFHRNSYETVVKIPYDIFSTILKYNPLYGSYKGVSKDLTWGDLRNYPGISVKEVYLGE